MVKPNPRRSGGRLRCMGGAGGLRSETHIRDWARADDEADILAALALQAYRRAPAEHWRLRSAPRVTAMAILSVYSRMSLFPQMNDECRDRRKRLVQNKALQKRSPANNQDSTRIFDIGKFPQIARMLLQLSSNIGCLGRVRKSNTTLSTAISYVPERCKSRGTVFGADHSHGKEFCCFEPPRSDARPRTSQTSTLKLPKNPIDRRRRLSPRDLFYYGWSSHKRRGSELLIFLARQYDMIRNWGKDSVGKICSAERRNGH